MGQASPSCGGTGQRRGFQAREMLDRTSFGALPIVDRTLRLLPPEVVARAAKWRFGILVAAIFLLHAALIIALLYQAGDPPEPPPSEEVPVEVVSEIPQEQPPPAPQEQHPPEAIKRPSTTKLEEKPEKPEYQESLKTAYDAPRAQNKEKVEREAPEKETRAPNPQTSPDKQPPGEKPAQVDTQKVADTPAQDGHTETSQPLPEDDKPDAEALNKAELQQKAAKEQSNSDPAKTKKPLPLDQKTALAKQLAALTPSPSYSLGSMSRPSPIAGGTENTTYFSVAEGLIMKQMVHKEFVRSSPGSTVIFIALDENGNLTHQAVYRSSGFPEIDQECMNAVRRAAPFPPPPHYLPKREFLFSVDVARGR